MTDTTTPDLQDLNFFNDPDLDRTVGLVLELAAQVHVERQRRTALEQVLIDKKIISRDDLEALAGDSDFKAITRHDLDQSLRQLLRVITERGDETGPLRAEALDMD
jgi:hypothetical protein